MIQRRIFERVRLHDWFAVAVELVIVVVGVFLGMQVTNWNADRLARRTAQSYVERIREDLARNEQALGMRIAYYTQVKAHALAALAALEQPKENLGEAFLVDAYQASQILSPLVDKSTYLELISAGTMNTIPDVAARRQIASFYQNVAAIEEILAYVPPYRERLRRQMPYAVQQAISQNCDDITTPDANGLPTASLPERCEPGLPSTAVRAAVEALSTPDFALDLQRRIADTDTKILNFRRLSERAKVLDRFLAHAGTGAQATR
jgi:hypothetical protein